jgi:glycosyltransferase involved in cell wall biosynthesis
MIEEVDELDASLEVILVVNGPRDGTDEAAEALHLTDSRVRVLRADGAGWGRAVRAGLSVSGGELLAYTNLARTPPAVLRTAIALALDSRGSVVKATRRVRDSPVRRGGSLLYNLQCRLLFDLSVFDVNGTPKVFPSEFADLRDLRRDDDLIDVEFVAICRARGYQVVEFSVPPLARHSGRSTTNLASAWHMYSKVFALRRDLARRGLLADRNH